MNNQKNFLFVNSSDFLIIRAIAFGGQAATLFITQYFFEISKTVAMSSWIIAFILMASILLGFYLNKGDKIISEKQVFLFLCFDIVQISSLIALNGGHTNPFIFIILAPIAIAASYLTIERIIIILSLALVCFALIFNFYINLPLSVHPNINFTYSLAIMISLFISSIFLVFYLYYFSLNYKSTQKAYELASKQLQNEKELLKVGGLAAAAVHELGTPLNTINLIVDDLKKDQKLKDDYGKDIKTLLLELDRCKEILKELSTNPESKELSSEITNMSLDAYVQSLCDQFSNNYRAAYRQILVISETSKNSYSIKIRDDGPGFDKKFIANFGKPFYSSRPEKGVNMGLGLFITKQMIENLNGEILVQSNDGAEVTLTWRI